MFSAAIYEWRRHTSFSFHLPSSDTNTIWNWNSGAATLHRPCALRYAAHATPSGGFFDRRASCHEDGRQTYLYGHLFVVSGSRNTFFSALEQFSGFHGHTPKTDVTQHLRDGSNLPAFANTPPPSLVTSCRGGTLQGVHLRRGMPNLALLMLSHYTIIQKTI